METKLFYKSRTMWVGILTTLGGVCIALAGHLAAGGALTVVGVVNIVLRCITKEALE